MNTSIQYEKLIKIIKKMLIMLIGRIDMLLQVLDEMDFREENKKLIIICLMKAICECILKSNVMATVR